MALTNRRTDPEQVLMGRALRALREARGLTQPQAAGNMEPRPQGISVQAWQNYEAGKRRFTPALIRRVTAALAATPDELMFARSQLPAAEASGGYGPGVAEPPSPLIGIVTAEGQLLVKRFHHILNGKLFVQDVTDNQLIEFDLAAVQGVHAVSLRGR
jgi:transcriptional regulator with XRE-family HTH domain